MPFCSSCGEKLDGGSFCPSCGNPVNPTSTDQPTAQQVFSQSPNPQVSATAPADDTELMQIFMGPNSNFYFTKFAEMPPLGDYNPSWNWSAFFFGLWWLLYRKMYLYGVIAWVATLAISSMTMGAGGIVTMVLIGLFANSVYRKFVREEIAKTAGMDPAARKNLLAMKGGVTWTPVIIALVIFVLLICAASALFSSIFALSSFSNYGY